MKRAATPVRRPPPQADSCQRRPGARRRSVAAPPARTIVASSISNHSDSVGMAAGTSIFRLTKVQSTPSPGAR